MADKGINKFYEAIGKAVVDGFSKAMSHPDIRIDMCPDFQNLLIITYGREIYKFMNSKKAKKLWEKYNG